MRGFQSGVSAAVLLVGLMGCVVGGCAASGGAECSVGADCASGVCQSNGRCLPLAEDGGLPPADGAPSGDAASEDAATPDAGPASDAGARDAGGAGCVPNGDGVIRREEVPLMAGLRATFRVATDVTVDMAGEVLPGGRRRWDLSGPLEGDRDVLVDLRDPAGAWYAEDFPEATYVTELSATEELLGVFQVGGSALRLLGVVSPDDGFTRTRLENDPAVDVLAFPLEVGERWTSEPSVSGLALGAITAYSEDYVSEVDAAGELVTPFGTTFEVLRVRTELERTVGLLTTTVRTFAFVSECFGTVATVTSEDDEDQVEFSRAAEVRRLAP